MRWLVDDAKEARIILGATKNEDIVAAYRRVAEQASKPPVEREVIKDDAASFPT
jgi:hypothetical protein